MEFFILLCGGLFSLMVYFFPTFIAILRKHPDLAAIFVINLFLGWSLIAWVVSLAWAFKSIDARANYRT